MDYSNIDVEDLQIYGDTPGGDENGHGIMNPQNFPLEKKLQLAERANEIYREQVKYLQDHLNGMRGLIQEKEYIIANLMLRYDTGVLPVEKERSESSVNIDRELRRKAEALAQRTILENFELREFVNDLREENYHLKNEAFDLQDQLNRQALYITKLTRQMQAQMNPYVQELVVNEDNTGTLVAEEAQRKHEERTRKHNRQQSSIPEPQGFWDENNAAAKEESEEPVQQEALTTQQMFGDGDDVDGGNGTYNTNGNYNGNEQEDVQEAEAETEVDTVKGRQEEKHINKHHGSKQFEQEDPRNTKEAIAKRQERQEKTHNRDESAIIPADMFAKDPAETEDAKKIREERARKVRQESIAIPKNFLSAEHADDSEDDVSREKRIKHQRKQSLLKAVGDKGHLSDEDTEKKQRIDYQTRRKIDRINRQKVKESKAAEKAEASVHHRRDSSLPVPDLGFEDPAMLLSAAQEEVKSLKEELDKAQEDKKAMEKQLQDAKIEAEQREIQLGKELETRIELKFEQEKNGLLATSKEEMKVMTSRINELKNQLTLAADSKLNLIQCTNNEINRLNRVINTLLQSEKCKEITRLLLDDCQNRS